MNHQKLASKFYVALNNLGYDNSYDAKINLSVCDSESTIKYEDQGGSFKFTFTPTTIKTLEKCSDMNGKEEVVEETYNTFEDFVDMFEEWYHEDIKNELERIS